ncbi:MAG TPA: hypothetical protein VLE70_15705 [Anaerolineae bacterium]|nr:hypothetical protein [Anaerolineae bacterium]
MPFIALGQVALVLQQPDSVQSRLAEGPIRRPRPTDPAHPGGGRLSLDATVA